MFLDLKLDFKALTYKSLQCFFPNPTVKKKMTVIIETNNGQIMKSMRNSLSREQQFKHWKKKNQSWLKMVMPKTTIEVRVHENTFCKANEDFRYLPTKYPNYHTQVILIKTHWIAIVKSWNIIFERYAACIFYYLFVPFLLYKLLKFLHRHGEIFPFWKVRNLT